jgi:hypothetical protein
MDEIKPITNQGFFSYVFKLSKFKQADLVNFIQYSALSIVPFILVYFYIKKYTPNITYRDSTLYITLVTFLSIVAFIIGIFFIDRIVNFIPTLSGKYYDVINLTNISIILIMVLLISRAGYAERVNILLYRFDNWFTLDQYITRLFGMKDRPSKGFGSFNMHDNETNQWSYEVAFDNASTAAKAAGADEAKATATGHLVVDKLKQIHDSKETTDAQRILSLSGTKQNQANSSTTTLNPAISQQYSSPAPLPMQGPTQQPNNNMYANTQNSLQNAAMSGMSMSNPYAMGGSGGGMGGGMMDSSEPEAANGALGSSFTSW